MNNLKAKKQQEQQPPPQQPPQLPQRKPKRRVDGTDLDNALFVLNFDRNNASR